MSWFSNLYGKITGMKTSTEQQDLMNKINDTYESIAKGVEDLNAKVINVKELKQKLKSLPPPPEKPKEQSSGETNKAAEKKTDEKSDKVAPAPAPAPAPLAESTKPTIVTAPEPAAATTTSSSSTENNNNLGPLQKPQEASSSSPLPRPGATEGSPFGDSGSIDYDGGKKRKTRAKSKRTIPKNTNNGERKKRQRTRKNKNKQVNASEANAEAVAQLT